MGNPDAKALARHGCPYLNGWGRYGRHGCTYLDARAGWHVEGWVTRTRKRLHGTVAHTSTGGGGMGGTVAHTSTRRAGWHVEGWVTRTRKRLHGTVAHTSTGGEVCTARLPIPRRAGGNLNERLD